MTQQVHVLHPSIVASIRKGEPDLRSTRLPTPVPASQALTSQRTASFAKNASAVRVLVCCSREFDATPEQKCPRVCRDLEGFVRLALRRELKDARVVRVEPDLGGEPPALSRGE